MPFITPKSFIKLGNIRSAPIISIIIVALNIKLVSLIIPPICGAESALCNVALSLSPIFLPVT